MPSTPLLGYASEKSLAEILPWRAHQRLLDRILGLISSVSNAYKGKVRIWEALNVLKMKGFECGGDLRESDVGLGCNTPRQTCKDVAADSLKEIRWKPVPADNLKHKDVAADSLKEIRRKTVPADNLKQSDANLLLLKIKPVRS
ncbi:hypothetical protein L1987_20490 [Smallanthus sonchifolius]|uniref:Uncharacterized protein n=1 Tax=Smallanthus sonchifolius TaxID=185202 RepID=A0ACB9IUX6_9ASTR|nr:hypothetical protein L1987_20490 [Smallanthus sonchifolius]